MTLISNKCFIKCAAVSNKSNSYIKDNIWFLNQTLRHSAFLATKLFFFPLRCPGAPMRSLPSDTPTAWTFLCTSGGSFLASLSLWWRRCALLLGGMLGGRDSGFLGEQPVAKMIVLMDSFLHDPSQLSNKKEEPPESQSTFSCSLSQIWCS